MNTHTPQEIEALYRRIRALQDQASGLQTVAVCLTALIRATQGLVTLRAGDPPVFDAPLEPALALQIARALVGDIEAQDAPTRGGTRLMDAASYLRGIAIGTADMRWAADLMRDATEVGA